MKSNPRLVFVWWFDFLISHLPNAVKLRKSDTQLSLALESLVVEGSSLVY